MTGRGFLFLISDGAPYFVDINVIVKYFQIFNVAVISLFYRMLLSNKMLYYLWFYFLEKPALDGEHHLP